MITKNQDKEKLFKRNIPELLKFADKDVAFLRNNWLNNIEGKKFLLGLEDKHNCYKLLLQHYFKNNFCSKRFSCRCTGELYRI